MNNQTRFLRLPALCLLGLTGAMPVRGGAPDPIRIMDFNIHAGMGVHKNQGDPCDGLGPGGDRYVRQIATLIERKSVDIACLQEVLKSRCLPEHQDHSTYIAKLLGYHVAYYRHHQGRNLPADRAGYTSGQGNAIVSRWPVAESYAVVLDNKDPQRQLRSAVFARILVPGRSEGLWVVCTHLDNREESTRLLQLAQLGQALEEVHGPVVLAGDFNDSSGSDVIRSIRGRLESGDGERFHDTWNEAATGEPQTHPCTDPRRKIDFIFATPEIKTHSARVLRQVRLSDHLPQIADLLIAPSSGHRRNKPEAMALVGIQEEGFLTMP